MEYILASDLKYLDYIEVPGKYLIPQRKNLFFCTVNHIKVESNGVFLYLVIGQTILIDPKTKFKRIETPILSPMDRPANRDKPTTIRGVSID